MFIQFIQFTIILRVGYMYILQLFKPPSPLPIPPPVTQSPFTHPICLSSLCLPWLGLLSSCTWCYLYSSHFPFPCPIIPFFPLGPFPCCMRSIPFSLSIHLLYFLLHTLPHSNEGHLFKLVSDLFHSDWFSSCINFL